ncbi:MAG: hypothetical protein KJO25_00680, partial [Bacteroidia bacterium]|nr:hypothetical protein [Bacteroidia bacterium]
MIVGDLHMKMKDLMMLLVLLLLPFAMASQVQTTIDSTSIRIGEQITYEMQVEADSAEVVLFPEGQTFMPLEVIESFKVDTLRENEKLRLIKR